MRRKFKRIFIVAAVITAMYSLTGCSVTSKTNNTTASDTDSKIRSYNSNEDIYEFVDPDTGVHYLVYCHSCGYSGMGGITPRLNADGSVMADKKGTTKSK